MLWAEWGRNLIKERNEIQEPKRKNVLINYEKLGALLGLESYGLVKFYHKKWVEEYLGNGKKIREDKRSASIAVGSRGFVESDDFEVEKDDIGSKNTYFWNDNIA